MSGRGDRQNARDCAGNLLRRAAVFHRRYLLTAVTFIAYSVPAFWLGLMLIIVFSVKLGWLPTSGIVNSELTPGSWEAIVD